MHAPDKQREAGIAGGLFIIFGPVLALGAFTALLATLAGLFGWHPDQMLATGAGVGAAVVVLALLLAYREISERQAARHALENVEARVSGIIDAAMDAIIAVDAQQRVVLFNGAAEKVFGRPGEAVLGRPLDMLLPERFRTAHGKHIEHFGAEGVTARRMDRQTVLHGLRADGEEFPIEASISHHTEDGRELFTVILRDVTGRVRAEQALRRSREELRELASMSNSVMEQEKRRIARELHDELAQALTALKMDATWVKERLSPGQEALGHKLASMQAILDATVAATRRISADLRPLMLDDLGLVPAVEWLVQSFSERTRIGCELAIGAPDLELQDPHASAVFRILQESLTNVARHAQASQVEVALEREDGAVMLTVRDNGRGFSPEDPHRPNAFGLRGLRERAQLLGGEVRIDSGRGRGTIIEVRIPLEKGAAQP